jgi:sugar lactone lactonase YvrE
MLEQVQVDVAVSRRAECGEGPVWDADANTLHWVDILAGEILTTDPTSGTTVAISYPAMVGAAAHRRDSGFVAAVATGFVGIGADGRITNRVDCLPEGVRMNDAKTDPGGRFWAGSCAMDFAAGAGGLWRLDEDWEARLVLSGLTQPNGMGWSPAGDVFYLVETQARQILSFPFDSSTSTLVPTPIVLVDAAMFPGGFPDGLAVDTRGHLWVAEFAGAAVHEFTAGGHLVRSVSVPTKQPTSCAFVGPSLDELWVTSAAWQIDPDDDPDAGSIFRLGGLGATGLPTEAFRG